MTFTNEQIFALESYLCVKQKSGIYEKKYIKKIQRLCYVFRFIPGLLMIGIGNSIAMKAGNKSSDIDLFVVTQKNTLWIVRIFITLIVQILGQRKTQKKHAGKICLSFFCTEEVLDFSKIAIANDIYLYYWVLTMKPILIKKNIYDHFMSENSWVDFKQFKDIHKNYEEYLVFQSEKSSKPTKTIGKINEFFKKIYLPRTLKHYEKLGKPFGVIISDDMLKFHDKDKREDISKKVLEKI